MLVKTKYNKFKEDYRVSWYSEYKFEWMFDNMDEAILEFIYKDRLSWNAYYPMDEDDKITIDGYYDMAK